MDFQYTGEMGAFAVLAVLAGVLGLVSTIFWMVVGWRAMIAHEKMAASLQELAARRGGSDEAT